MQCGGGIGGHLSCKIPASLLLARLLQAPYGTTVQVQAEIAMEALYGKIADTDDVLTNAEKRTLRVTYNILVNDVAKFRAELQRIHAEQQVVGTVTWQWNQS